MPNIGEKNEFDIIDVLNNKKYKDLSPLWKENIKRMFSFVEDNDLIKAYSFDDRRAKPDITIKVRKSRINVSIKSGSNPSVHQEYFYDFFQFLKKIGVSSRTRHIISFYHFGVSKKLGNNGEPFTKDEIIEKYSEYIIQANEELNSNKEIIKKIVYHAVIAGNNPEREPMDYFYYGNPEKGFLLDTDQIYDMILKEEKPNNRNIHFGGLIYQPSGRKLNSRDRNYSKIKWPVLSVKFYDNDILK